MSSSSVVYLMRHGDRVDPWHIADCPLSEIGCLRASQVKWNCDLVIISPLLRCRQTLEHSGINFKNLKVNAMCRERCSGSPPDYLPREEIFVEIEPEFQKRVADFRVYLQRKSRKYPSILVVTHGVFGCVLAHAQGLSFCETVQIRDL